MPAMCQVRLGCWGYYSEQNKGPNLSLSLFFCLFVLFFVVFKGPSLIKTIFQWEERNYIYIYLASYIHTHADIYIYIYM